MEVTAFPLGIPMADEAELEAHPREEEEEEESPPFGFPFFFSFLVVVCVSIADRWLLYRSLWQLDVAFARHPVLSVL